jgi:hypothetical protein
MYNRAVIDTVEVIGSIPVAPIFHSIYFNSLLSQDIGQPASRQRKIGRNCPEAEGPLLKPQNEINGLCGPVCVWK